MKSHPLRFKTFVRINAIVLKLNNGTEKGHKIYLIIIVFIC